MVKINKIYTRTGDTGETRLGDGSRCIKTNARIVVCGSIDELNSTLGLCLSYTKQDISIEGINVLLKVQNDLFDLGADLCIPESSKMYSNRLRITQKYIDYLEQQIDKYNNTLAPLDSFILPGGTTVAAILHISRTIARRVERDCLKLMQQEDCNPLCQVYLNRLSDLLFVMARINNNWGKNDILWQPNKDNY